MNRLPEHPILLILGSHGSHVTDEIVDLATIYNVKLLCLPPHITHKLQPLDVSIFGPLQQAWAERCNEYVARIGIEMQR